MYIEMDNIGPNNPINKESNVTPVGTDPTMNAPKLDTGITTEPDPTMKDLGATVEPDPMKDLGAKGEAELKTELGPMVMDTPKIEPEAKSIDEPLMPFQRVEKECPPCPPCPPQKSCREPPIYHNTIPRLHSTVMEIEDDVSDEEFLIQNVRTRRKNRKLSKSMHSRRELNKLNNKKKKATKKVEKKLSIKKKKQQLKAQLKSIKKELGKLTKRKRGRKNKGKKSKHKKPKRKTRNKRENSFVEEIFTN